MNRQAKPFRCLLRLSLSLVVILLLGGTAAALDIGEPAPDFSLPSTSGDKLSLSQFKGKKHVLIQFYSVDFNPT